MLVKSLGSRTSGNGFADCALQRDVTIYMILMLFEEFLNRILKSGQSQIMELNLCASISLIKAGMEKKSSNCEVKR